MTDTLHVYVCRVCRKVTAGRKPTVKSEAASGTMYPRRHRTKVGRRFTAVHCPGEKISAKVMLASDVGHARFVDLTPVAKSGSQVYKCTDLGHGVYLCGACFHGRVLPEEVKCPECEAVIER